MKQMKKFEAKNSHSRNKYLVDFFVLKSPEKKLFYFIFEIKILYFINGGGNP